MSKNLFDYAKKELSQDGFLMWLIDSYNDENEEIRNVSRSFIEFLTGISKNEKNSRSMGKTSMVQNRCYCVYNY